MFAVIKTGGKQYRARANDEIAIERLPGQPGDKVVFEDVLMISGEEPPVIGAPVISGAKVTGEIVGQTRGDKIIVFKKRRRKNSRRRNGHRQDLSLVRITDIHTGSDAAPKKTKAAAEKAAPKAKAETKAKAAAKKPAAKKAEAKKADKA